MSDKMRETLLRHMQDAMHEMVDEGQSSWARLMGDAVAALAAQPEQSAEPVAKISLAMPHVVGLKCAKCGKPAFCSSLADPFSKSDELVALCEEHAPKLYSSQPEQSAEPVAWAVMRGGSVIGFHSNEEAARDHVAGTKLHSFEPIRAEANEYTVAKLYTAPPAPSVPDEKHPAATVVDTYSYNAVLAAALAAAPKVGP